jgi:hypothetical protein
LKLPGLVAFSDVRHSASTGDVPLSRPGLEQAFPLNPIKVHSVFQVSLFMLASQQNMRLLVSILLDDVESAAENPQ